jgi:hypothetical protein
MDGDVMSGNKRVLRANQLSSNYLDRLFNDEILLLIIENFYQSEYCRRFAARILDSPEIEKYTHEVVEDSVLVQKYFGVDRLGFPFNSTYDMQPGSEIVERYYSSVAPSRARLRSLAQPALTPIDKLRLELDDQYVHGASVAGFQGKKMLTGIARITRADISQLSAEQPHFDALPESYARLDAQFAANIYLKMPKSGGDLEIWDVPPLNPKTSVPDDWRSQLTLPVRVKPLLGDLIIFNCRRPHAVCEFRGSDRVSMQTFIGYRKEEPLQLWN